MIATKTRMNRERIDSAGGEAGSKIDRSWAEAAPSANKMRLFIRTFISATSEPVNQRQPMPEHFSASHLRHRPQDLA